MVVLPPQYGDTDYWKAHTSNDPRFYAPEEEE
jgi:hypothetical protein